MECPNCGSETVEGRAYCGQCGALLETTPAPSSAPPIAPHPPPAVAVPPPLPLLSEQAKRRLKLGSIVVAAILIIGALGGYLYYYQPVRGTGTVSTSTIDAGQSVQFSYIPSKGVSPYRYTWDFGDGGMSSEQSPHHAYASSGTYVCTVTIRDTAGIKTTWSTTVLVNALPSVTGTVSPSVGDGLLNASFTAQGHYGTPGYSYLWQFGDGATSDIQNPVHIYTVGNYTVVVVIEDSVGMTASWSMSVSANPYPIPSVVGTVTPSVGSVSLNASFTAQGVGGTPGYSYLWQFGDGTTSDVQNPTHHYSTGIYTAVVLVEDDAGMTATWSANISVNLPLMTGIEAVFTGPGFTEAFYCTPSQGVPPYSYYWQFGDGESSTMQNPSHIFGAGTWYISLNVTDSIGETVGANTAVTMY